MQVLPVNDTQVYHTFWDSYPYSAISVFALHPLYLSLETLVDQHKNPKLYQDVIAARAKHKGIDVEYNDTLTDKLRIARLVFDSASGRR
jgi:4-alpha-glucanotransferase